MHGGLGLVVVAGLEDGRIGWSDQVLEGCNKVEWSRPEVIKQVLYSKRRMQAELQMHLESYGNCTSKRRGHHLSLSSLIMHHRSDHPADQRTTERETPCCQHFHHIQLADFVSVHRKEHGSTVSILLLKRTRDATWAWDSDFSLSAYSLLHRALLSFLLFDEQ